MTKENESWFYRDGRDCTYACAWLEGLALYGSCGWQRCEPGGLSSMEEKVWDQQILRKAS